MTQQQLLPPRSNKDHLSDEQIVAINRAPTPECPNCQTKMVLRRSRYGLFYGCQRYPVCQGTHGAHPNGKPLGTPATDDVKRLRIRAHALLDAKYGRKRYFSPLAKMLGIPREQAHIAMLTKTQLETVIAYVEGGWDDVRGLSTLCTVHCRWQAGGHRQRRPPTNGLGDCQSGQASDINMTSEAVLFLE